MVLVIKVCDWLLLSEVVWLDREMVLDIRCWVVMVVCIGVGVVKLVVVIELVYVSIVVNICIGSR